MRLRGGALCEVNLVPLGDKGVGGHARADGAAGRLVSAGSRADLGLNFGTARLYTSAAAASCSLASALRCPKAASSSAFRGGDSLSPAIWAWNHAGASCPDRKSTRLKSSHLGN